jgi:hypothetical protein
MLLPKLPTVFKQNRTRGFDYQPMYYDQRKEELENLKKKYEGEPVRLSKESFRANMRGDWKGGRGKQVGSSNSRLLVIIAILSLITYYIIRL